jgi:hypothetical protein
LTVDLQLGLAFSEATKNQDMIKRMQLQAAKAQRAKIKAKSDPKKESKPKESRRRAEKQTSDLSSSNHSSKVEMVREVTPYTPSSRTLKKDLRMTRVSPPLDPKNIGKETANMQAFSTALKTNPDVIILNEYRWYDKRCDNGALEATLERSGYTLHYASVFSTTAIATKFPVARKEEATVNDEHNAVLVLITIPKTEQQVWICSTNLTAYDEHARQNEVEVLLGCIKDIVGKDDKVIISGDLHNDLNQTAPSEESTVSEHDSGSVGECLADEDFISMTDLSHQWLDESTALSTSARSKSTSSSDALVAVDFTFSRNIKGGTFFESQKDGLTVCDWFL